MASRPADVTDRATLLERLSRHRMLGLVGRTDLQTLLQSAQPRTLVARQRLFATGDAGSAVYVVLSGWMKLSREGPAGRDVLLEVAGAGTVFGELAVICGEPRTADATALTASRLLAIDGRNMLATLRQNPEALLGLVRMLSERLARTRTQMEDLMFLPAEARLARALTRLAALEPHEDGQELRIDLGLSQRDLGEITGLSRESINKQLAHWRDAGIIGLQGRTVALVNSAALSEIADAADL